MQDLKNIYSTEAFLILVNQQDRSSFGYLLGSDVALYSLFGMALTTAITDGRVNSNDFVDGLPVPDWCKCHSSDRTGGKLSELVLLLQHPGWHVVFMDHPKIVFGGYCDAENQEFHFFTDHLSRQREVKTVTLNALSPLLDSFKCGDDWDRFFYPYADNVDEDSVNPLVTVH